MKGTQNNILFNTTGLAKRYSLGDIVPAGAFILNDTVVNAGTAVP